MNFMSHECSTFVLISPLYINSMQKRKVGNKQQRNISQSLLLADQMHLSVQNLEVKIYVV